MLGKRIRSDAVRLARKERKVAESLSEEAEREDRLLTQRAAHRASEEDVGV